MQNDKWATKVTDWTKKDGEIKESELISIDDTKIEANTDLITDISKMEKNETTKDSTIHVSNDRVNEQMVKLMLLFQENSEKIEHLTNDITAVKKDLVNIKEMQEYEDIQSLKVEMKNGLEIHKD